MSLLAIYNEVAENNYSSGTSRTNVSLTSISDGSVDTIVGGNKTSPHAMSEWYGYDHDSAGTSFSSVIADFSLTAGSGATVYSSLKTFTLTSPTGALTATLTDQGGSSYGQLYVSISDSGDPGTSGTGNSATGFTLEGSTATILNVLGGSSSGTIYVRYKFKGHSSGANEDFNCTFTCNSVSDVVVVTKSTTR